MKKPSKVGKKSKNFFKQIKKRKSNATLSDELLTFINSIQSLPEPEYPHMYWNKTGKILCVDLEANSGMTGADYVGSWKKNGGQGTSISVIKDLKSKKVVGFEIWGLDLFCKENNIEFNDRKY